MVITAQDTKLKPGYKRTEVGVIPEDWKIEKLGDCLLGAPQYGINAPAVQYRDSLPIYIRITDITDDSRFSPENIASVSNMSVDKYVLKAGDLVFARTGASVGKTYLYKPEDGILVFAGYLIRVKANPSKLLPNYLAAYVKTEHYWNWVRAMSMRSGQPGINGTEYAQLPIPLPSPTEQRVIATALSDMDALIESLDKLIAKKSDIKQATMQQLLTGKTRLPGFSGEWKKSIFSEIVEKYIDYRGRTPKKLGMVWGGGDILALSANNVHMGRIDTSKEAYFGSPELYKKWMVQGECEKDDVLLTMEAPLGNVAQIPNNKKYILSQRVVLIKPKAQLTKNFLTKLLAGSYFQNELLKNASGSTAQGIQRQKLDKIEIFFPKSIEEQTDIATILSDMDAEIAALEQKRDKIRDLKQGMMHELLTGKTRLV